MFTKDDIFEKYKDETGEKYFCPVDAVADHHIVSEWELENCVEVSTVSRYAGHLKVADQRDS